MLAAAVVSLAFVLAGGDAPDRKTGDSAAAATAQKPNIVLVLTDDQRWDTLFAMPTVQRDLVGHGASFRNAFVVNPLCCPSRASILTGRYSHSTGVYLNQPPRGGYASFRDRRTIATVLRRAGYRTGLVGRYLNGYRGTTRVPPGWDRWFAFTNPGFYGYELNVDGRIRRAEAPAPYSTDVLRDEAVGFIRQARRPFFLVFAPYAVHLPTRPATRHAGAFDELPPLRPPNYDEPDVSDKPAWVRRTGRFTPRRADVIDELYRRQLESLLAVDEAVGAIVETLRDTGQLENTMIVFTSDNGISMGSHRVGGKVVPYEESIRVPFVVRYDRILREPIASDRLVLNTDLAPTFARIAGRRMPGAEGRSLLPLLRDAGRSWRRDFLVEHLEGPPQPDVPTYCAVRSQRYAYILYATGEEELYDLARDPYELENRAGDSALGRQRARLRTRLRALCDPPPPGLTP